MGNASIVVRLRKSKLPDDVVGVTCNLCKSSKIFYNTDEMANHVMYKHPTLANFKKIYEINENHSDVCDCNPSDILTTDLLMYIIGDLDECLICKNKPNYSKDSVIIELADRIDGE